MKKPVDVGEEKKRAFLVGIRDEKISRQEADSLARELESLIRTLGLEIAANETVHVREKSIRFGMGSGKAEEIAEKAASLKADCIVFDRDLSPSQQRNWEELSGLSAIDRQELIIQIFAGRCRSKEAVLQVSLAELNYALPRLQHKYINLSRQRGGSYGTRGAGETRYETDRRKVTERIHRLEEEIEEVRRQRSVQRKQRERQEVPVCAIVGYTNAGKSSILNALTDAGVLAEDKLFATLDSTSRKLELPGGLRILLVDTVGFIRRLPHSLVHAFHSTLEEVCLAALLLNVVDASDPDAERHFETTLSVLKELGADAIPMITVLNKADRQESPRDPENFLKITGEKIPVSAKDGTGLEELKLRVERVLSGTRQRFRFPAERTDLAAFLHREGQVVYEKYGEGYIEMEAMAGARTGGRLKEYSVEEFTGRGQPRSKETANTGSGAAAKSR